MSHLSPFLKPGCVGDLAPAQLWALIPVLSQDADGYDLRSSAMCPE